VNGAYSIERAEFLTRLFTPTFVAETLRTRRLYLRSRHGQNFLVSRSVAERVLEHAAVQKGDTVLEIGPGLGQLTFLLAERAKRVIAVEIDGGVAGYLREAVREVGVDNVTVVDGDFLGGDFRGTGATKVVSNFPYSIALRAILKILEELTEITAVTGMVQRETAERMTAEPGTKDYAAVSALAQFLAEIRVLEKNIAPGNFFPVPEVTSAVVSAARRKGAYPVDKELFERVVKAGFAGRRKTLIGNLLKAGLLSHRGAGSSRGEIGSRAAGRPGDEVGCYVLRRFGDSKVRAERLSVGDFVEIAKIIGISRG
jgi:16S rRNA (adenine1518-N6/adenine1519-N6)-dimethyltransferase